MYFTMLTALDVHYRQDAATAAGIVFPAWESTIESATTYFAEISHVASYVPGSFYLRELPCLLSVLRAIDTPVSTIVIDGYVSLGETGRPGLGMHLWESIRGESSVIGVAKTAFQSTPEEAKLFRGTGHRPLFISSVGMPLEQAKSCISSMDGRHRIPTLLRAVDRLSRTSRLESV